MRDADTCQGCFENETATMTTMATLRATLHRIDVLAVHVSDLAESKADLGRITTLLAEISALSQEGNEAIDATGIMI